MAETITNITQPAPIFEEGAKKYLSELTKQTDYTKALDTSKFAPGVAQQNALAQAAQQQAATQAGLGTLSFDPTTGAVTGTTGATGIGGYQQFLTPAAAQAGAAQTTLGNVRGQLTGAQTAAGLAQPLLTQAGQDIGTAATTLGGVSPFITAAGSALGQAGTTLGGVSPFISAAQSGLGQAGTTLAGTANPLAAAAGLTGTGAGTGTGSIQSYMSPYQSAVRDATLAEYDTQAAAQRAAVTQQAGLGTVGNLDSGRFGVQLGAFDAQQQRDRALIDAQLGQQGFGQASQARQQDLANQLGLAGAQQQFAASQAGLAGQQLGLGQATSALAGQQAGLGTQQLGLGQATAGLAGQQAGLGSQRQQLAASQQQLAGTGLGLGSAEQQLAQQQLGLGQYYGNLAQLQPQLAGQNLAIGQGLAGQDLQYRQAVEDAARQANQMAQFEPIQRLDRFGQGLTGVMGGLGSVQTQTGPAAPAPSPVGSAISSGIGALTMGKLFGYAKWIIE